MLFGVSDDREPVEIGVAGGDDRGDGIGWQGLGPYRLPDAAGRGVPDVFRRLLGLFAVLLATGRTRVTNPDHDLQPLRLGEFDTEGQIATAVIADELAVHPDRGQVVDRLEVQRDAACPPGRRQLDESAIEQGLIRQELTGHPRGDGLKGERNADPSVVAVGWVFVHEPGRRRRTDRIVPGAIETQPFVALALGTRVLRQWAVGVQRFIGPGGAQLRSHGFHGESPPSGKCCLSCED